MKNYAQKNELNYNWIDCQTTKLRDRSKTGSRHDSDITFMTFPFALRDFHNYWNHCVMIDSSHVLNSLQKPPCHLVIAMM